ncbi:hypothetical protein BH11MYX4_BH11MYX4_59440 [soil metagenome]
MEHSSRTAFDQAYAAPQQAVGRDPALAALRVRSAKLLGASTATFALSIGVLFLTNGARAGGLVFLVAAGLAAVGAGYGVAAVARGASAGVGAGGILTALGLTAVNLGMTGLGALAAFLSTMAFTRGRQIRSLGKILLPPVEPGAAWTTSAASMSSIERDLPDDPATRRALAAQWRENGRTEHASVAAFARLTLDLMGLGAPPELVIDANRDALDEIRHAQLCFGLARALDGRSESPGAFPAASHARTLPANRTLALGQLAVDSLIDGALHEGVSARIIAKLARRCEVSAIEFMLKEIAADEGKHARHGWDVVQWCLAEGGEPVARALEGALRALPRTMTSPIPDAARGGLWERFGIMGEALEAEEHAATRAYVERRTAQAIAAHRASGQSAFGYGNAPVG